MEVKETDANDKPQQRARIKLNGYVNILYFMLRPHKKQRIDVSQQLKNI